MRLTHATTSLAYRLAGAVGLGIFAYVIVLLIPLAWPPSDVLAKTPTSAANVTRNSNISANSDIIEIAQQQLVFSDKLGYQLISHMPNKGKAVMMTSVGDKADQKVATEFEMFLRHNGYHHIQRLDSGGSSSPPRGQISVSAAPEGYYLTIAPSAP